MKRTKRKSPSQNTPATRVIKVKISSLKQEAFVRVQLSEDRIEALALLIEGGQRLDPIEITSENVVIDGRHRIEAHRYCDLEEIEAVVVAVKNKADMIVRAYKANVGGSLPPTVDDIEHTVSCLLKEKLSKKEIGKLLRLPEGITTKLISSIEKKIERRKLEMAATDVTENGLTVAQAAAKHDVDQERLKNFISPRKRRLPKDLVGDSKKRTTRLMKSTSSTHVSIFQKLVQGLDNGEVTLAQIEVVFKHLEGHVETTRKNLETWRKRLTEKAKVMNASLLTPKSPEIAKKTA